jgi:hypothetical protein
LFNFIKEWGRYGGVWCKEVQCPVMGELKQIKVLNVKFSIVASLPLEYEALLETLVGALIMF